MVIFHWIKKIKIARLTPADFTYHWMHDFPNERTMQVDQVAGIRHDYRTLLF